MTSVSYVDRTMEEDARESKLPVWAQQKLRALRAVVAEQKSDLEAMLLASKPEESEALLNPYGNMSLGTGPQGLGKRVMVRWPLTDDLADRRVHGIDVRQTSDAKWLMLSADGRLTMEWDAANTCRLQVR